MASNLTSFAPCPRASRTASETAASARRYVLASCELLPHPAPMSSSLAVFVKSFQATIIAYTSKNLSLRTLPSKVVPGDPVPAITSWRLRIPELGQLLSPRQLDVGRPSSQAGPTTILWSESGLSSGAGCSWPLAYLTRRPAGLAREDIIADTSGVGRAGVFPKLIRYSRGY